ncbi:MAG: hypothetical protein WCG87_13450, partial [Bacteroidota bacterium]
MNGIIKYNIEHNGCLVGIYTNTGEPNHDIYPDMAKKKQNGGSSGIEGEYDALYFNSDPKCELHIERDSKNENVFHFKWFSMGNPNPFHIGIGIKVDEKTILSFGRSCVLINSF